MARSSITTADTSHDGATLGRRLRDPQRRHPIVVLTIGQGVPGIDPEDIAARTRGRADVAVVADAAAWTMNESLPEFARTFGGAARVYPVLSADGKLLPPNIVKPTDAEDAGRCADRLVEQARERVAGRTLRGAQPATTGAGRGPAEGAVGVDELAAYLQSPSRAEPVVVVTAPLDAAEPLIDVTRLREEAGADARVEVLTTRAETWRLRDLLDGEGVYGGAGRIYPPGTAWLEDGSRAPLRVVRDASQAEAATEMLVDDLVAAWAAAGASTTTPPASARPATGTVASVIGGRGVVRLADGELATVWPELVVAGLEPERLLAPGMTVDGTYDPQRRRLDVRPGDSTEWWQGRAAGEVVLARVADVDATAAQLQPTPEVTVAVGIEAVTGNPLDRLTDLLSPGEVLLARVVGAGGERSLSLLDVDDDEDPVEPPSVLPGGPPWLDAAAPGAGTGGPVNESPAPTAEVEPLAPEGDVPAVRVTPGTSPREIELGKQVDTLREEVRLHRAETARMERRAQHAEARASKLQAETERLRTENRRSRATAQRAAQASRDASPRETYGFAEPVEQLRWELQRTWVECTRPEDKRSWPMPDDYVIGERMVDSLQLEGVAQDRVLRVAVMVLTGRGVPGDHELRQHEAGNAPAVTRADGAVCRRAPLQQKSPSARRLSYWRLPDGRVELSRVALHDDLEP
ncbi:hypothetical protein [Kytococcus schroeteri]|uniref:hypothetical protein n=1 Tax=Kytococcus schroeteri TaxID=138300 RepID=UPI0011438CB8|nr:hypothetical protein [Kytococcus schroeteri]